MRLTPIYVHKEACLRTRHWSRWPLCPKPLPATVYPIPDWSSSLFDARDSFELGWASFFILLYCSTTDQGAKWKIFSAFLNANVYLWDSDRVILSYDNARGCAFLFILDIGDSVRSAIDKKRYKWYNYIHIDCECDKCMDSKWSRYIYIFFCEYLIGSIFNKI